MCNDRIDKGEVSNLHQLIPPVTVVLASVGSAIFPPGHCLVRKHRYLAACLHTEPRIPDHFDGRRVMQEGFVEQRKRCQSCCVGA